MQVTLKQRQQVTKPALEGKSATPVFLEYFHTQVWKLYQFTDI